MEARLVRAALLAALLSSALATPAFGQRASARSQHFLVTAPTPQLARRSPKRPKPIAATWPSNGWGTSCRRGAMSVRSPSCRFTVLVGATSFLFDAAGPYGWAMEIQGSRERMLDSVLAARDHAHGLCHALRPAAAAVGRRRSLYHGRAPRRKGQAGQVPDPVPHQRARHSLQSDVCDDGVSARHFAALFAGLFAGPLPDSAGGKRKYVDYVGEGMRTNNWPATTRKFYGFENLSELQVTWVEWVRQGSPSLDERPELASRTQPPARPATQLASLTQQPQTRVSDGALSSWQTAQSQNARAFARADDVPPQPPAAFDSEAETGQQADYSRVSRPVSDGWYARRRDEAQQVLRSGDRAETPRSAASPAANAPPRNALPAARWAAPQSPIRSVPPGNRQVLLE
jgi:hypothetical protein